MHKTNNTKILAELNYSSGTFGSNITRLHKFKIGFLTAEIHIADQLTLQYESWRIIRSLTCLEYNTFVIDRECQFGRNHVKCNKLPLIIWNLEKTKGK